MTKTCKLFLLCIFGLYVHVDVAIADTMCPTPCGVGQFCSELFDSGMYNCFTCLQLDGIVYTGPGTVDGDNRSCPVECNPDVENIYGEDTCSLCPASHPYAEKGAKSIDECYKTCTGGETTNIENGQRIGKAYYPSPASQCTYVIQCNNSDDICTGYHEENEACVPNKTSDGCPTGYYKFFDSNTFYVDQQTPELVQGKWSDCLISESDVPNDYTFIPYTYPQSGSRGVTCDNKRYGTMIDNNTSCASKPNLQSLCSGGTISGDISYSQSNTPIYSACTCTMTQQQTTNGQVTQICNFNSTGTALNTSACTTSQITSCDAGYYLNNGECVQTLANKFSPAGKTQLYDCPLNTKCAAGAGKDISDCTFSSTIKFYDKDSTPISVYPKDGVKIKMSKMLIKRFKKTLGLE